MSTDRRRVIYVLRSLRHPERQYAELTSDVAARLAAHNNGDSPLTSRHRPWKLVVLLQFADEQRAAEFEKYLKTETGRAFAIRHFL